MFYRNATSFRTGLVAAGLAAFLVCAVGCESGSGGASARSDPAVGSPAGEGQPAAMTVSGPKADLARCLTERGVVLYGAYWCGACRMQENLFGDAARHLNRVECYPEGGSYSERCQEADIEAFPCWIRGDGQKVYGVKGLRWLAEWSGCPWEE